MFPESSSWLADPLTLLNVAFCGSVTPSWEGKDVYEDDVDIGLVLLVFLSWFVTFLPVVSSMIICLAVVLVFELMMEFVSAEGLCVEWWVTCRVERVSNLEAETSSFSCILLSYNLIARDDDLGLPVCRSCCQSKRSPSSSKRFLSWKQLSLLRLFRNSLRFWWSKWCVHHRKIRCEESNATSVFLSS